MSTYDEQAGDGRERRVPDDAGIRDDGLARDDERVRDDEVAGVPATGVPATGAAATDGLAHDDLVGDDVAGEGLGRDDLEGGYTDVDEEGPHVRTVHGQYTETAEYPGPEPVTEGSYVDTDGTEEDLAVDEQGEYTDSDFTEEGRTGTGRRARTDDDLTDDGL